MGRAFLLILLAAGTVCSIGCGSSCSTSSGSKNSCSTTTATVTITLTPDTTTNVPLGGTLQFTAEVSGYSNTKLTWQVNGKDGGNSTVGTISSNGLYTTPKTVPNPSTVTVSAISQANTNDVANVSVVIVSGVTVTVSPQAADVLVGKQQQFAATVTGNSNTDVTWSVAGIGGGNSSVGTITAQGLYSAPSSLGNAPTAVAVTATAAVDATKTGTASLTLHNSVSVNLSPNTAAVQTFGQQQFTAGVSSDTSASFSWQVNGIAGGNSTYGRIVDIVDATGVHHGVYTAPNHVPTASLGSGTNLAGGGRKAAAVTVTATYQADSYFSASSLVTITSANQKAQSLPTLLGVSGGNSNDTSAGSCCGGTLGALVSRGGQQYILSNSHVLARTDMGAVGDSIVQPGLFDASCSLAETSTVATLSQFVNLESASGAPADAALALVSVGKVDQSGVILQLGGTTTSDSQPTDGSPHAGSGVAPSLFEPDGTTPLKVAKSGRATGLTCSSIAAINLIASVTYQKGCGSGEQFQQTYTDLVVVEGGDFSAQGDSGALIVTQDTADPIALLFAGSDTASLGSPVSDVLSALADPATGEKPIFVGSASTHSVAACSLAGAQSSSRSGPAASAREPSSNDLASANRVRDYHEAELLAYPGVGAVGLGASLDSPGEAAIVLFVTGSARPGALPQQVDGVRIRVVEEKEGISRTGTLSAEESGTLIDQKSSEGKLSGLSEQEIARARGVHEKVAQELMHSAGVQAVGITVSADDPSESALVVFTLRGANHAPIPALIDGVRTRIRESGAFRAGFGMRRSERGCSVRRDQVLSPE